MALKSRRKFRAWLRSDDRMITDATVGINGRWQTILILAKKGTEFLEAPDNDWVRLRTVRFQQFKVVDDQRLRRSSWRRAVH